MEVTKHGYHIMTAKLLDSDECKKIIDFIEDNIDEFKTNKPRKGYNTNTIGKNLSDMTDNKDFKEIDDLIFKAVSKSINIFIRNETISRYLLENIADSGYELRKVIGPTRKHTDGPEINALVNCIRLRVATLVISLAGTGDTLEFPDLDISIPLEEGTFVFFPPYWTHAHESIWSGVDSYRIQTWITNDQPIKK